MNRVLRVVGGAALGIALVLCGGTAYGWWVVHRAPAPATTLVAGGFDVQLTWLQQPNLTGLLPNSSATGTARVTMSGDAPWRYRLRHSADGALGQHLRVTWYANSTCDGTGLALDSDQSPGPDNGTTLPAGASSVFCVRYRLAADAPSSLQGAPARTTLTVVAEQVAR